MLFFATNFPQYNKTPKKITPSISPTPSPPIQKYRFPLATPKIIQNPKINNNIKTSRYPPKKPNNHISNIEMTQRINPDYTSDLRHIERFIFDNNLYMLQMFEKKVVSFTNSLSWENKEARKQQALASWDEKTTIDPQNFLPDPLKTLSKDLTKPLWNCIMKVVPKIIYRKESHMEPIEIVNVLARLFGMFFQRYKNQHEDQSNLHLSLQPLQLNSLPPTLTPTPQPPQAPNQPHQSYTLQQYTCQLFTKFLHLTSAQLTTLLSSSSSQMSSQQEILILQQYLNCFRSLLVDYLEKNDQSYCGEINIHIQIISQVINDVCFCKIGSAVLCPMPQWKILPLFLHPVLVGIYGCLRLQVFELSRKDKDKDKVEGKDKVDGKEKADGDKDSKCVFQEMPKIESASRVVFINLDGYQSQYNLDLAKHLCKNLLYISFPRQSPQPTPTSTPHPQPTTTSSFPTPSSISTHQLLTSTRLLHKYHTSILSPQEHSQLLGLYSLPQKEHKKNLYLFPIFSKVLSSLAGLSSVLMYESAFVQFVMNQVMYNNILEFNPSLIIVSYSGKLRIEDDVWVQFVRSLTVLAAYKVVLYCNIGKNYMFDQFYPQQSPTHPQKLLHQQLSKTSQSQVSLLHPHPHPHSQSQLPTVCPDLFQKISSFIKISSGTFSLVKAVEEDCFVKKFKNYKVLGYVHGLVGALVPSCPNLQKFKLRMNEYNSILKVMSNYFNNNKSDGFEKYYAKVLSRFYLALLDKVEKAVLSDKPEGRAEGRAEGKNMMLFGEQRVAKSQKAKSERDVDIVEAERREKGQKQIQEIKKKIWKKYSYSVRKENIVSFKFRIKLEICTQKIQTKFYAHIPKYSPNKKKAPKNSQKQAQNLICLQFFTMSQKQNQKNILLSSVQSSSSHSSHPHSPLSPISSHSHSHLSFHPSFTPTFTQPLSPTFPSSHIQQTQSQPMPSTQPLEFEKVPLEIVPSRTQVHYTQSRPHPQTLIYLFNNLTKSSTQFSHLYGIITQEFDYKVSPKVQMFPVTFKGGPQLQWWESYTQFSFFQNFDYVFLFWPKIYDHYKATLCKYLNQKYQPQITSLVFCAKRQKPGIFTLIHTTNPTIIPRSYCKCYSPTPTQIYIFGGFYPQQYNHLYFQTDITRISLKLPEEVKQQLPIVVRMENIPKQFYFGYYRHQRNKDIGVVSKIYNDMVRPKIQYEFIEPQDKKSYAPMSQSMEEKEAMEDEQGKVVFMVGGVGQKFVRPCSLMGYVGYKMHFSPVGELLSIKHILLHNIIPVNLSTPTLSMGYSSQKSVSYSQNRQLSLLLTETLPSYPTLSHSKITYNPKSQRFDYVSEYQFCDPELLGYRDQLSSIRRVILQPKCSIGIHARCPKGPKYYSNYITLQTEDQRKYIIQLQLILSLDIKHMYPQLPPCVKLTGSSIIGIDIHIGSIYAIVRHPIYTQDYTILTYFDLNQQVEKIKDLTQPLEIQLKQLHKFQEHVQFCGVVVANSYTILVLHGQKFYNWGGLASQEIGSNGGNGGGYEGDSTGNTMMSISTNGKVTDYTMDENKKELQVCEYLIKRYKKKYVKLQKIYSNQYTTSQKSSSCSSSSTSTSPPNLILQHQQTHLPNSNSLSIFLNMNNGTILNLNLKTIQRNQSHQKIILMLESLDITKFQKQEQLAWKIQKYGIYNFIVFQEEIKDALKIVQIGGRDVGRDTAKESIKESIKESMREGKEAMREAIREGIREMKEGARIPAVFQVVGIYRNRCVVGLIDFQGNKGSDIVLKYNGKTSQEYYKENQFNINKQYFGVLQKCYEDYHQLWQQERQRQYKQKIQHK